ncbi:hypothetical protein FQA39_LY07022 [Lamprigera yunnana]|nr:hypothetical protein FQA39_LY07022 [Lamprigera yunnana]
MPTFKIQEQIYHHVGSFLPVLDAEIKHFVYISLQHPVRVIETARLSENPIPLDNVKKKCSVLFAAVDDPMFKHLRNKYKFDIYSCRYKLDSQRLIPLYARTGFDQEESLRDESDSFAKLCQPGYSRTNHSKRKLNYTSLNLTSESETEELSKDKKRLVIALKNLKLTSTSKECEHSENLCNKTKSAKQVLGDSFEEPGVSYTIVNTHCDSHSIKLKFKLDNPIVYPTILTDEVVKMKSPIKLGCIKKIDNRIEICEGRTVESDNENDGETSEKCIAPIKTPAKINLRRSTRTVERKSYSKLFLYEAYTTPHSNSITKKVAKSLSTDTKSRIRRTVKIPKRYGVNSGEETLPDHSKKEHSEIVSSNNVSTKKNIDYRLKSRRSLRTIKRPIRYVCPSTSPSQQMISTPSELNNVSKSDTEIESKKPKTTLLRSEKVKLAKSTLIENEDEDTSDILNTPCRSKNSITSTPKSIKNTPSVRARMVRQGAITPSVQARQKAIIRNDTPLSTARNMLHVSYVPKGLSCREQEYFDIANFLKGKLMDGCGGCMYVSGVPGTGKTATVSNVIEDLQELAESSKIPSYKYININGMQLSEPRQAYVEIIKQLQGKTMHWEQAQTSLENVFTKTQKKSLPIIMVIDELDILCTKRQDVVYNLLDWSTKTKCQLIVVTIANTMDLPERLLLGRVTSRLGLTRLTFQPYTHKQLQEIVTTRLLGTDSFNSDAIQLVARKVASVSGDARRALDICRKAAEIAEVEGKYTLVTMVHVNAALNAMITQPKVQAIKHCSVLEKLILQSIVAEECFPVIGSCQISSILSNLDPTASEKCVQSAPIISEPMDLIILENPDYKVSTHGDLQSGSSEFILLKENGESNGTANALPNECIDSKENVKDNKKTKKTKDFENILYFVCNLCPYLCIKYSKITHHLKVEHKHKVSSKPLQLKCPACPNIFFHKLPLRSHLVYDHKVGSMDLPKITQAVTYFSKKGISASDKTMRPKINDIPESEICYKNETDSKLIKRLMSTDVDIDKLKESTMNSDSCHAQKIQILKSVECKSAVEDLELPIVPEVTNSHLITIPFSEPLNDAKKKTDPVSKFIDQKKLLKCTLPMCKIRLQDPEKMDYHIQCHSDGSFKCPECLEIFSFWKPLTGHLWRLHRIDMELHSCDLCDYKSFSLGKLNNIHRLIHGDLKAFTCEVCQKSFKNMKQLRNHKMTHSNKFNQSCAICDKVFSNRRQMKVHMDGVHNKIKPFLCNYCGYKGASKSALKMHIRQHTGEKPFSCDSCEYTTADHNSLRRHKLRHTGYKPYKCEHCNYACIQSTTYKVHLRTKHPGLEKDHLFICSKCQFKTVNHDMYLSHLFVMHEEKVTALT